MKLHAKFFVLVLGSFIVFFGSVSFVLVQREADILAQKSDQTQQVLAFTILKDLKNSMLIGAPRMTIDLMNSLQGTYGLVRLEVLKPDGSPAFGVRHDRFEMPQLKQALDTGKEISFQEHGNVPLHTILYPLKNERDCHACHGMRKDYLGVLLISLAQEDILREIRNSKNSLMVSLAVLIVLMGGLLYLLIRGVLIRPLAVLHSGSEKIGGGDFAHRINLSTGDELQDLAGSFNAMASRIEATHADLEARIRERTAKLSESITLRDAILASMSSGVMLIDPIGTIQIINQAGADILRSRPPVLLGRRLEEVLPDAAALLRTSIGPYQEADMGACDGTRIPIGFSSAYCYGTSGAPEGIIVVFRDLTEIKALQNEALNRERFAAMGKVVAGVAHEIRNPLFGISSISQIFERELTNPAQRELAHALLAETKRLNQLVEELLIYGRPMKLVPGWCNLAALWHEVTAMNREEIEKKRISLGSDSSFGHVPAYVDADQIRQVFLNLLRNAIEATPAGGEITVGITAEERDIVMTIADTGSGIPPENMEKIFDLFFTTKPRGTGLGLGICKKIVEDHGGVITVTSSQWGGDGHAGTLVTIKLPQRVAPNCAGRSVRA